MSDIAKYKNVLYKMIMDYTPEAPYDGCPQLAYIGTNWHNNSSLIEVNLNDVLNFCFAAGELEFADDTCLAIRFSQIFREKHKRFSQR